MKEKQFILKMKMIDGMTHTFPFSVPCGEDGAPGKDGHTPVKGVDYFDGAPGKDGADGKSAYAYAQEGGYTGTEEEFAADLAKAIAGGNVSAYNGEVEVV